MPPERGIYVRGRQHHVSIPFSTLGSVEGPSQSPPSCGGRVEGRAQGLSQLEDRWRSI